MSKGNLYKTLSIFSFMPLPLPWFDNQIDPLLPTDIKPLLYLYDQYQTYDLVEWSFLTPNWGNNLFPFDFLNYKVFLEVSTILVERFTPWDYEWAEHYSTKIFNFIYNYTGTDYDLISGYNYITGLFYDFTSGYQWQGEFFNEPRENYINNEQVTLNIPATEQEEVIIITWLEYDDLDLNSSQINSKLKAILTKRYKKFTTSNVSKNIVFSLSLVALCSVVISSSTTELALNIKQQLNIQKGILYDNLDSILDSLELKLTTAFPRLFKVIDRVTYNYEIEVRYESKLHPTVDTYIVGGGQYDNYIVPEILSKARFTYRERPNYYRSACLLYANNNYWQNGTIYNDLGKIPKFYINTLLPEDYQPPYPSHDLIYIETPSFLPVMSEPKASVKVPGASFSYRPSEPDQELSFAFIGKPYAHSFGSLLKTTSGEKHYLYKLIPVWHYANEYNVYGSSYNLYKYFCILTHIGDGNISVETGSLSIVGHVDAPTTPESLSQTAESVMETFRYFDYYAIDVVVDYHYFDSDNNFINSDPTHILISNEKAIELIDNYLYQSSVLGEFDNA